MFAESNESTAILPRAMRIVHPKAFHTLKIGLTGMGTWIFHKKTRTAGRIEN